MSKIKKIINILLDKEEQKFTPPTGTYTKEIAQSLTTDNNKVYLTVTEISKEFKIKPAELNTIFSQLKWAYKQERWWLATEVGSAKGAKEFYDTRNKVKYLKWSETVKKEFELINAIKGFKEAQKIKATTPKEKGDRYEEFIAQHYRGLGYFVWEHGKEKGRKDRGIDLIVKKNKEIIFIQCKNWKENTRFKIDHKEIKASRTEAREFMKDNPLFIGYKTILRYTLSGNFIHPSAIKYIEENSKILDYEVLRMEMN